MADISDIVEQLREADPKQMKTVVGSLREAIPSLSDDLQAAATSAYTILDQAYNRVLRQAAGAGRTVQLGYASKANALGVPVPKMDAEEIMQGPLRRLEATPRVQKQYVEAQKQAYDTLSGALQYDAA